MPGEWVPIVFFCVVGWIASNLFDFLRRYKIAKLQAEVQQIFVARFSNEQQLLPYLESEAGRKFLTSLAQETPAPYASMLACIRWGLFFLIMGETLSWMHVGDFMDANVHVVGWLTTAVGVSLEAAAAATYFVTRAIERSQHKID